MKKNILFAVVVGGVILGQATYAGDWEFSLGLNYRTFDEIEYDNYSLENPNNTGGTAVVDDGVTYTENPNGTIFLHMDSVPNSINFDPPVPGGVPYDNATLHQAAVTGQDGDIDDGMGIILGARKEKRYRDTCYKWGIDLSLATAFADTSNAVNATMTNVNLSGLSAGLDTDSDGLWDTFAGLPTYVPNSVGADVAATVDYDLDLGVYTFGAGLSGAYERGALAMRLSCGPTLTLSDFDIRRSETVTYNSGANTIYRDSVEDDGTEFDLGAYIAAGMEYQINTSTGIGLSLRYDWIPNGPETDLADLELSGVSGLLQLLYKF